MAGVPITGGTKYWMEGLPVNQARVSAQTTGELKQWLDGVPMLVKDVSTSVLPPGRSYTWMGTDESSAWVG